MLKINFVSDGKSFSDFNLLEDAQSIINDYKIMFIDNISVSSGNIIEAIRVLASRDKILYSEIQITFNNTIITLDETFLWSEYPDGFLDWDENFLFEIRKKRLKVFE